MKRLAHLLAHTWVAVRGGIHNLEYEPRVQWKFHLRMTWFWVFNVLPISALLYAVLCGSTDQKLMWTAVMLGVNTYYSLYANFCTEFDGIQSAYAAMKGQEISQKQDIELARHKLPDQDL